VTADERAAAAQAAQRLEELGAEHRRLRELRAAVGDLSAAVHEEAARVHEDLERPGLLDPEVLRAHAQQDRDMAAEERAALAAEQAALSED
jgi:hypothetical protein